MRICFHDYLTLNCDGKKFPLYLFRWIEQPDGTKVLDQDHASEVVSEFNRAEAVNTRVSKNLRT